MPSLERPEWFTATLLEFLGGPRALSRARDTRDAMRSGRRRPVISACSRYCASFARRAEITVACSSASSAMSHAGLQADPAQTHCSPRPQRVDEQRDLGPLDDVARARPSGPAVTCSACRRAACRLRPGQSASRTYEEHGGPRRAVVGDRRQGRAACRLDEGSAPRRQVGPRCWRHSTEYRWSARSPVKLFPGIAGPLIQVYERRQPPRSAVPWTATLTSLSDRRPDGDHGVRQRHGPSRERGSPSSRPRRPRPPRPASPSRIAER